MPKHFAVLLAGAAGLFGAGSAFAAPAGPEWHTTTVALPDGSQAEIRYVGDVPPQVTVSMPVVQKRHAQADEVPDKVDGVDGGIPRARRIIQARPNPPPPQATLPQLVVSGGAPEGSTYEYTLITTGTDGKVCAQRTEWTSRGRGKDPQVRRDDTGEGCASAAPSPEPAPSAPVPAPPAPDHKPIRIDPDAI
ncbi:hypothetical protein KRR38_04475 [Novosphingobium sp. G106]|uniref:hypothetical protein n=1 Tax=Novosphingobium sp. G106 TaxID=2849500 RepID=UPI001C2DCE0A|nr:hypothetical protein [Novosphingobium sp. G106]MBV1686947.1 hypothetical protein [Novosphingobium sp. G106]